MLEITWLKNSRKIVGCEEDEHIEDIFLYADIVYNKMSVKYPQAIITASKGYDTTIYTLALGISYRERGELIVCNKNLSSDDVRFLKQNAETWILMALISPEEKPKFLSSEFYFDEEIRHLFTQEEDVLGGQQNDLTEEEDFLFEIEEYLKRNKCIDNEEEDEDE